MAIIENRGFIGGSNVIPETFKIKEAIIKTEKDEYTDHKKIFLEMVFEYETTTGEVREIIIPKIKLPFEDGIIPSISQRFGITSEKYSIAIGDVELPLRQSEVSFVNQFGENESYNGIAWADRLVKTNPKEMTLSEIEKELGYKVKIISEDKPNG